MSGVMGTVTGEATAAGVAEGAGVTAGISTLGSPDSLRSLFRPLLGGTGEEKAAMVLRFRNFFFSSVPANMFQDEYCALYALIHVADKLQINGDFVRLSLLNNAADILNAPQIHFSAFSMLSEEDALGAFINKVVLLAESLRAEFDAGEGVLSFEDWQTGLANYISFSVTCQLTEVLTTGIQIAQDNVKIKNKVLSGVDDAKLYVSTRMAALDNLKGSGNGGVRILSLSDMDEDTSINDRKRVGMFHLPTIDAARKGIYTTTLTTILAPPKNGKSRFSAFLSHGCAVYDKANIIVWPLEGGVDRYKAYLRACHYHYYYNLRRVGSTLDGDNKLFRVTVDDILTKNLDNYPNVKALEAQSYMDLRKNVNYGQVTFIDGDCTLENFIPTLDLARQSTNATVVIVDYLQLIGGGGRLKRNERISEAYIQFSKWLIRNGVAGISPAQFKQDSIDDAFDMMLGGSGSDSRTWGGESAEIIRGSDSVLSLYATEDELRLGRIHARDIASRDSGLFEPFTMFGDLGICYFAENRVS